MSADGGLEGALAQAIDWGLRALYLLVVVASVAWLTTGIRRVRPGEQVVVLRAGAVRLQRDRPGLIWCWPPPIEEVVAIPGRDRALSYVTAALDAASTDARLGLDPREDGGYALCASGGLVHLRAQLIYQVEDPRRYALTTAAVPALLERIFATAAIRECAGRTIDELMIHDLDGVKSAIAERMNLRFADPGVDPGVRIRRVDLTVSLPAEAADAFAQAQSAITEASTAVAQARTSARAHLQEASGRAERLRGQARGATAERVSRARIAANDLDALLGGLHAGGRADLPARLWVERVLPILEAAGRVLVGGERAPRVLLAPGEGER